MLPVLPRPHPVDKLGADTVFLGEGAMGHFGWCCDDFYRLGFRYLRPVVPFSTDWSSFLLSGTSHSVPSSANAYVTDGAGGYTEPVGCLLVRFIVDVGINLYCRVRGYLCASLSWTVARPALFNAVLGVVVVCSKEKVVRVYAGRDVAVVKNAKTIRYWSSVNDPRESVRELFTRNAGEAKRTVAKLVDTHRPQPASSFWIRTNTLLQELLKVSDLSHWIPPSRFVGRYPVMAGRGATLFPVS